LTTRGGDQFDDDSARAGEAGEHEHLGLAGEGGHRAERDLRAQLAAVRRTSAFLRAELEAREAEEGALIDATRIESYL
jgi:hypothetical protein